MKVFTDPMVEKLKALARNLRGTAETRCSEAMKISLNAMAKELWETIELSEEVKLEVKPK